MTQQIDVDPSMVTNEVLPVVPAEPIPTNPVDVANDAIKAAAVTYVAEQNAEAHLKDMKANLVAAIKVAKDSLDALAPKE
jgi:hypothetical protein